MVITKVIVEVSGVGKVRSSITIENAQWSGDGRGGESTNVIIVS